MLNKSRPVFLNLLQIRLPITAIASILHRVSGVLLFLAIPTFIYLVQLSLQSQAGFEAVLSIASSMPVKLLGVLLLWALIHHLFAGVRFLLLDVDIGITRSTARASAWLVSLSALLVSILLVGVCL